MFSIDRSVMFIKSIRLIRVEYGFISFNAFRSGIKRINMVIITKMYITISTINILLLIIKWIFMMMILFLILITI